MQPLFEIEGVEGMNLIKDEIVEFNKECAEFMVWEAFPKRPWPVIDTLRFKVPNEVTSQFPHGSMCLDMVNRLVSPKSMRFHNSYDWAMILVKQYMKRHNDNIHMHLFNLENAIIDIMGPELSCDESSERWGLLRWTASPYQIGQAILGLGKS